MMQYLPGGANIGDAKGSMESLERAWQLIEPLQRRQPGDAGLAIEAANILSSLAYNRQAAGGAKPGEVRAMLAKAHGMIAPIASVEGMSGEQAERLLSVHMRYGASLQSAGELRPALAALETTERLCRAALARHGEIAGIRWLLGNSIYRQGDVYGGGGINLGQFPRALEKYQEAERVYAELRRAYPENARYNAGTSFIYQRMGSAYERMNRLEEAIAFTRKWGELLAASRRTEPNNHEALRELAISHANLGTLLQKAGRLREAAEEAREGLRLHREHAARTPGAQPLGDVGIALLSLAIIESKSGRGGVALGHLEEARGRFQEAIRLSPDLPMLHWRLGRVYEWMGKVHGGAGSAACRGAYESAAAEFELLRDTNRIAAADRGEPARLRELAGRCANGQR
jgi:tetratricopeptide (TPR) repeat protein